MKFYLLSTSNRDYSKLLRKLKINFIKESDFVFLVEIKTFKKLRRLGEELNEELKIEVVPIDDKVKYNTLLIED